jgi:hypothetical protein
MSQLPAAAGTTNLVVTVAAAVYFGFVTRQLNLGWIYDSYVPLMSAAIALSFALSAGERPSSSVIFAGCMYIFLRHLQRRDRCKETTPAPAVSLSKPTAPGLATCGGHLPPSLLRGAGPDHQARAAAQACTRRRSGAARRWRAAAARARRCTTSSWAAS